MSLCNNTPIQIIDLDECIGISLATINTNFKLLEEQNCLTTTELITIQNELTGLNAQYAELTSYRLGYARATAAFDGTGTAVPSVYSSFNVARILRRSTGVFELSYLSAFPNSNYALIGTSMLTATSGSNFSWVMPTTAFAPTSATINIRDQAGVFVNPGYVSIAVYSL